MVRLLSGDRGRITPQQVVDAINPDDVHKARTSLVCLENTSNRGGGSCYDLETIAAIREVCDQNELLLHLDGARLFNALVAKKQDPKEYGRQFHSISICLSKGLGAPVGSVLIGSKDMIRKARRIRKAFGGGMRQAGFIAAAGIYALNNHIERLHLDHEHARRIAAALEARGFEVMPVETNIIIFHLPATITAKDFVARLKEQGILAYAIAPQSVRLVTHLDITPEMVEKTISVIQSIEL